MVSITEYNPKYRKDIIEICWRTGYMGEEAKRYFEDSYLFGLLFCLYYVDYEPHNCFIALNEENNRAIGYILSSFDSKKQETEFKKKMMPKILKRTFFYTLWRYPRSFKTILYFRRINNIKPKISDEDKFLELFPAHLHIDILPEFQNQGIGTTLLKNLENYLIDNNITGVHMGTSNFNHKAISFYKKNGYKVIYKSVSGFGMWPTAPEAKSLIFGKRLKKHD